MTPRQICDRLMDLFIEKNMMLTIEPYWFVPSNSEPDAYIYRLKDTKQELGVVSIDHIGETEVTENNPQITIHVRDIDVPEAHRGQGIARAILLYGLCDEMDKHPAIEYSFLEDDTPFAQDKSRNLYHEFGYRFKEGDLQEKILALDEFKTNYMRNLYTKVVDTLFKKRRGRENKTMNRKRKSRSKSRSKNKNQNKTKK